MTGARIVSAAGRDWIGGLVWRAFPDTPKLTALREDADDLAAQWVAVRNSPQVIQAGFCPEIEGHKPRRLYSLAAAIADSHPQPWLGIYQLRDDLWWYVAVRDGQAVLPDGDLMGDLTAVEAARERHAGFTDWDFVQGSLADLLPVLEAARGRSALVSVRSVEPPSPWRIIAPGLAAAALAAGIGWTWHHHVVVEARERHAALLAEHARIRAKQKAVSPLLRTPVPSRWLAACRSAVERVPVSNAGWAANGVACDAMHAIVSWDRLEGGTVTVRPAGALGNNGDSVTQTISFPPLPAGADHAHGLTAADTALYALLQPLGVEARISAPPVPPSLPGQRERGKPPPIPTQSVRFVLPVPPFDLDFDQVPGLRLTGAKRDAAGWIITGVLYGR